MVVRPSNGTEALLAHTNPVPAASDPRLAGFDPASGQSAKSNNLTQYAKREDADRGGAA